jgi:hypothetical protein
MYRSQPLGKFARGVRSYLSEQKCGGRRSLSSSRVCHGNLLLHFPIVYTINDCADEWSSAKREIMNPQSTSISPSPRHPGPNLGVVATVFTVLFNIGLYPVTIFHGEPWFPGPWESANVIVNYFETHPSSILICSFFQFGASIPLGIFTASMVSQLRFLGARAAGSYIALFGGLATSFNMAASAAVLWVMAYPGIAQEVGVLRALFYLQFVLGGPGFSVPLGLLLAGISVPAGFMRLLPKWLAVLGLAIAVLGELSWFSMVFPRLLFLIPLTRFPAFAWLITTGFLLPKTIATGGAANA